MALLFQFGLEQRLAEVGTLLALGFTPKQVRRIFLGEALALSVIGACIGVAAGIAYARGMLLGLGTIWRAAVQTSALGYHAQPVTLLIGFCSAIIICTLTIAWVMRKQAKRPAYELLAGGPETQAASQPRWNPLKPAHPPPRRLDRHPQPPGRPRVGSLAARQS